MQQNLFRAHFEVFSKHLAPTDFTFQTWKLCLFSPLAITYLKRLSPPGYIALPPTLFCSNELINASLRNKCCDARFSLISWIGWRRYLNVFQREMSLLLPDVITSQLVAGCAKSKVKVVNNTKSTLKHKQANSLFWKHP